MTAQPDDALGRVIIAHQQLDDGRLARPAGSDDADTLAFRDRETEIAMRRKPATGIREPDMIKRDCRRQPPCRHGVRRCADRRFRIQQVENAHRRRLRHHALMQKHAKFAQRAEDLDPHHQDHQQRRDGHIAIGDAIGTDRQRRRRAHGDTGIGDAARQGAGGQQPHGAAEQVMRLLRQYLRARSALAE